MILMRFGQESRLGVWIFIRLLVDEGNQSLFSSGLLLKVSNQCNYRTDGVRRWH